jgi:hypothetical protein
MYMRCVCDVYVTRDFLEHIDAGVIYFVDAGHRIETADIKVDRIDRGRWEFGFASYMPWAVWVLTMDYDVDDAGDDGDGDDVMYVGINLARRRNRRNRRIGAIFFHRWAAVHTLSPKHNRLVKTIRNPPRKVTIHAHPRSHGNLAALVQQTGRILK